MRSTFSLAWLWLPVQLEYHYSGEFSFRERLKEAIYKNLFFYFVILAIAVIYVIYMVSVHNVSLSQIVGVMMAMGNTYGVLLIIVLMGNGLVSLPKRMWEMSDYDNELTRLYMSASSVESSYQEAMYELDDCELEVKKAARVLESKPIDHQLIHYMSILNNRVSSYHVSNKTTTKLQDNVMINNEDKELYSSKKGFVDLNARVIRTQIQAQSCEGKWRTLLAHCNRYEVITIASTHSIILINNCL